MKAAVVRRLGVLLGSIVLLCTVSAGMSAPFAQAAVAGNATLTAVTTPANPSFNPLCTINIGGLSSILCNKIVRGAIEKGVKAVAGPAAKAGASAVASSAGNVFFDGVNQALQSASQYLLGIVGKFIGAIQTPDLQSQWFFSIYNKVVAMSLILLSVMTMAALLFALCTLSASRMLDAFKGMFIAVFVAFGMPFFLQVMLVFADALASAISGGTTTGGTGFTGTLSTLLTQMSGSTGIPVWVSISVMVFVWTSAFLLYLELLVRSVCLYAGLLFAPVFFTTRVMGTWGQRMSMTLIRTLLALIFSVPVMVGLLVLGASAMSHVPNSPGLAIGKPMIAAVTMFLALLSPFALVSWARQMQVAISDARSERAHARGAASSVEPETGTARVHTQLQDMRGTHVVAAQAARADDSTATGRAVQKVSTVASHPAVLAAVAVVATPEAAAATKAIAGAGLAATSPRPAATPR